ncbi:VTT domain-containing protein [Niabella yanshanensis]|uniref:VTT domain-containing protein n=1 Tax=Niabella yanshanensis TaxID=577386 RepID=A0ABZ0WBD9_9BACT|nr:VTT domain-containing protein [Niabella yanshanensis]WQD38882.1 VTT domain-containing protein [Niabella yanshanensis]
MDAESIIRYGGLVVICLLVFGSIGLFFCFFLPIGAVLFSVGLISAKEDLLPSLPVVCVLLIASAVAGSITGYGIGRSTGKFFYSRKESRFFRRSYLSSTEDFYKKHGSMAIAGSYFLPIVRSFAPVLAGIIKVKIQRFIILSTIGSAGFILTFVLTGYLMGSVPFLQPWLKYIIAVFLLVVTIPLIIKVIKTMRKPAGS